MAAENTILVVDDDPAIHQVLNAAFAPHHWHVENARNAAEALRRLRGHDYDLVITDVQMPGMDGLELLRHVREHCPATRVLIMTGDGTPSEIIRSIREHAYSYFSKPFSSDAVVDMVRNALDAAAWEDDIHVYSARPEWIELGVRCKLQTADRLAQFLLEMKMDLPARDREQIASAFRELLLNAIEHGGRSDPRKRVFVSFVRTSRALMYYIRDPGKGFSFADLRHAAVSNAENAPVGHLEARSELGIRPGGFGILLARHLVDELIYNEKGNEVLFIKYLNGSQP